MMRLGYAISAFCLASVPASAQAAVAADCLLGSFSAVEEGRKFDGKSFLILSDLDFSKPEPARVTASFDGGGFLGVGQLASVRMVTGEAGPGSFTLIFDSEPLGMVLRVSPEGDPYEAARANRYVGVLGVVRSPKPSHIGNCQIVTGGPAAKFYEDRRALQEAAE
jgi:hypothetical protein